MESATPHNPLAVLLVETCKQTILPALRTRPGVWCEAISTFVDLPRTASRRDGYAAPSPEAAIRWMRATVRTVASVLGPHQAGQVLKHWVDGPGSARACDRLRRGESCSLTLYPGIEHLTLQARPVRFLPLAAADGGPPCDSGGRPPLLRGRRTVR
ncbi:hypothetical protein F0L17_09480 [Streptomyces sp. TRM43335]|uniref:Uncharacterized protein n=1 Tax=Streptomyces taklimakanensis TaxID=2569853 RepID=A0A6G2BAV3_9ACTN|nr:hypothetical protein [Streptomyces taklimakanensis]MTE19354.1 hypothetical protein [Streptomyces taklimakanensis]